MMRDRTLRRQVSKALDERREREADNTVNRYAGPWGDRGLHLIQLPCNDEQIVASGPARTFAIGAQVMVGSNTGHPGQVILSEPPPGRRGSSRFALDFPSPVDLDVLGLESASPEVVYPGSQVVTFTGGIFNETPVDVLSAVIYNESTASWDPDPDVTIGTVTYISETSISATVTLAAGVSAGRLINVLPARG